MLPVRLHALNVGDQFSSNNLSVIDGDSLRFARQEIRLFGIDAVEYQQYCHDAENRLWHCGKVAKNLLQQIIKEGTVRCIIKGKDRYKRYIAQCFSYSNKDIAAEMTRQGMAVAYTRYSLDYLEVEREAHRLRLGVWQGIFEFPELWRYQNYRKH